MSDKPQPGDVFTVRYPFMRVIHVAADIDVEGVSYHDVPSWKPGAEGWSYDPFYERETSIADAAGEMILTVVSVHQPGKYPTRVFFTRQWKDPDGKTFGKRRLHIAAIDKFRRLSQRYQRAWKVDDRGAEAVLRAHLKEQGEQVLIGGDPV